MKRTVIQKAIFGACASVVVLNQYVLQSESDWVGAVPSEEDVTKWCRLSLFLVFLQGFYLACLQQYISHPNWKRTLHVILSFCALMTLLVPFVLIVVVQDDASTVSITLTTLSVLAYGILLLCAHWEVHKVPTNNNKKVQEVEKDLTSYLLKSRFLTNRTKNIKFNGINK